MERNREHRAHEETIQEEGEDKIGVDVRHV